MYFILRAATTIDIVARSMNGQLSHEALYASDANQI